MRGASVRMNMAERETLLWVMERWRTKRDALHHGINRFGRRLLRLCDRMYGCNIGNRRVGQKGRLGWYMTAIPLLHRVVCVVEKDVAPPDPCSGARLERVTYRIHNLNASVRVKNSVTSPALEGKGRGGRNACDGHSYFDCFHGQTCPRWSTISKEV